MVLSHKKKNLTASLVIISLNVIFSVFPVERMRKRSFSSSVGFIVEIQFCPQKFVKQASISSRPARREFCPVVYTKPHYYIA